MSERCSAWPSSPFVTQTISCGGRAVGDRRPGRRVSEPAHAGFCLLLPLLLRIYRFYHFHLYYFHFHFYFNFNYHFHFYFNYH
eukprot:SAG11_NODE_9896_length_871_cov_2.049223_2_plen_82_part_01